MNTDRRNVITCASCGQHMDITNLSLFAEAVCPRCGTACRVKDHMGHYKITGVLGKGGMSIVYCGEDPILGRKVALKVLNEQYSRDNIRSERFEKEARIMAKVSDENLVHIYSVGRDNGLFYIAMELVDGGSLETLVSEGKPVSEKEILHLAAEIVRGLQAAWDSGVMHRDIKPANILRTSDGTVKIVDFGLSLLHSEQDVDQEIWVTPYYAAPETLRRGHEDFRTDMYALGVTLFHLLTGVHPQIDNKLTPEELFERKKDLPLLEHVNPNISPLTCHIVNKLMSFSPDDRFSSYAELMRSIEVASSVYEKDEQESSISWAERRALQSREIRRKKKIRAISLCGVCVLGLILIGVFVSQCWNKSNAKPAETVIPEETQSLDELYAMESVRERKLRYKNTFDLAQTSLDKGDLVKASSLFGSLSRQPDCPPATVLWSGFNYVLCQWIEGAFPEGMSQLASLESYSKAFTSPQEQANIKEVASLISLIHAWNEKRGGIEGINGLTEYSVYACTGLAIKSWRTGNWRQFGFFYDLLKQKESAFSDVEVRSLASCWVRNLQSFARQYDLLLSIDRMPEKDVTQVSEKQYRVAQLQKRFSEEFSSEMKDILSEWDLHLRGQSEIVRNQERVALLKQEERKRALELSQREEEKYRLAEEEKKSKRSYWEICAEADSAMRENNGDSEGMLVILNEAKRISSDAYVRAAISSRLEMLDILLPLFTRLEEIIPTLKNKPELELKDGTKGVLLGRVGHRLKIYDSTRGAKIIFWNDLHFKGMLALTKACRQKSPEAFSISVPDTFAKPLLIFGYLNGTITDKQKQAALSALDFSFTRKWKQWMWVLEGPNLR